MTVLITPDQALAQPSMPVSDPSAETTRSSPRHGPRLSGAGVRTWVVWADLMLSALALGFVALLSSGAGNGTAVLAILAGWPLLLTIHGAYRRPALQGPTTALRGMLPAVGSLSILLWVGVVTGLLAPDAFEAWVPVVAVVGSTVTAHVLVAWRLRRARLLLVGDGAEIAEASRRLDATGAAQWEIVGACITRSSTTAAADLGDVPTCVGIESLRGMAAQHRADVALVLPGHVPDPAVLRRTAWALEQVGTEVVVGTPLLDVSHRRTLCTQVGGWSAVHVSHVVRRGPAAVVRTCLDRVLATTALVVLLPLLCLLAVIVRWDSPGAAVFRQERIGRDGRPFMMLKLRTMHVDADSRVAELQQENSHEDGPLFKMREDPRVTRVGRLLRRYSLDELPQLVNVLRGEMSLVGPRPALPREVAMYDGDARRRLHVRPGLTGLWQVSGRSELSWNESLRLDVEYVDNWSLSLDAAIIGRTLGAVLSHRGAY